MRAKKKENAESERKAAKYQSGGALCREEIKAMARRINGAYAQQAISAITIA